MKKLKIVGIVVFSLVFVSLIIIAMPLAGVGGVNVASASSLDYPGVEDDPCDDTKYLFHYGPPNPTDILNYCDGFKAVDKPLNEPIKAPDDITKMLEDKSRVDEKLGIRFGKVKVSPTALAVWFSTGSTETKLIKPYLVYLDTDGDGKPEELAALYNYPYKDTLFFDEFSDIKGHYKFIPYGYVETDFGVVINPFDVPKEDGSSVKKLIYIENPDKIYVLLDKTINWKDAIGKTPKELGLDKYDRGIFGRTPSQTSSPAETTPSEVPKGEEKGIPGFEALFAIMGLLAVAYTLRRRRK